MDRQIILNKFMQQELQRYQAHFDFLNQQYNSLPKGSITHVAEGQYSRVLRENGKQIKVALGPHDNQLLEELRFRRQIKESLPALKKKIENAAGFLKKDHIFDPLSLELPDQYYEINPRLFLPEDFNPAEWAAAPYRKSRFYANDFKHLTEGGVITRSKSEAMIGTQLERHGLNYRYEQATRVCGKIIYPDFLIMHPVTRRLIYWEHFGKLDDLKYVKKNVPRLSEYSRDGFYLGINLVFTYETLETPLTIKTIDAKIHEILHMC